MGTKGVNIEQMKRVVARLAATQMRLQTELEEIQRRNISYRLNPVILTKLLLPIKEISKDMKKEIAAIQSELQ